MRYSLLAGGKRIRPVLALATASALGKDPADVLPLAAALELIHTYSLIHDDLPAMDDDDLRRGRPTCHVKYGEDIAILAGDGLYAEAFRHLLQHQQAEPANLLAAAAELATATGASGMVGGQYIDVRGLVPHGDVSLRRLHELKTGRLIAASVECVLLLTSDDASATRLAGFRAFAAELGVLFQIVDDILDVTGTEDALGKPQGSDERHGKLTYVSQYGVDGARRMAADSHRNAREDLAAGGRRGGARAHHGLHLHAHVMTKILDRIDKPPGPPRPQRGRAPAGRPGGARAADRHGRRDRRALRRQPRRLRDRRRRAQPARLPARQGRLGRRPSGLPAQGPHRPPRPAPDDPQVPGAGAVLLDRRVRARHHGRRPRLDRDRLRGRPQGGHAARRGRGRQGRRRRRRRRHDRRRGLRGGPPGRRPRHPDRRDPQRQRDVDRAQRRRSEPLLQPGETGPRALEGARGRGGEAHAAAGRHRRPVRAPRPAAQGVRQGPVAARPVVGGARLGLHGRHRRPRRARRPQGAARRLRGRAARRHPRRHRQGQGLRARRGRRPGGHGEVARRQAALDRGPPPRRAVEEEDRVARRSTPRSSARRWCASASATSAWSASPPP